MRKKYDPEMKRWYVRYYAIRSRCNDRRNPHYGAKGIECRFRTFEEFYAHVSTLPGFGLDATIDRIDPDRHYEIGNIRFASEKQQARNRKTTTWVDFNGERMSFAEFVERFCVIPIRSAWNYFNKGVALEEIAKHLPAGRRGASNWNREREMRQ